ncbi:MAG: hypothetical protein L0H15_00375 [Nitrosospira sp.]|nr:hypothetical protein [Nitrosospira sp.]MDN5881530.1 hypothetical protein [Nitrosospira sp.]
MRVIVASALVLTLALTLAACATVNFFPYEGKRNLYEGAGGTKIVVDKIDVWANGTPPRKYSIIGMMVIEIGSDKGDEAWIRSAVASEVKKRGGSAAIQVTNNSSFAGVLHAAPGFYMPTRAQKMQFAIVKYVE